MPKSENTRELKALLKRCDLRAVVPKNTLANHLRGQVPGEFWIAFYARYGLAPEGWLDRAKRKKIDRLIERLDRLAEAAKQSNSKGD